MYHKALERDLISIFGVKKVLFGNVALGKEQEVLYCDIEKNSIRQAGNGKANGMVFGKIAILAQAKANPNVFFLSKKEKANPKILSRFSFSSIENNIDTTEYDVFFNCYSIDFVYFWREDFDPVKHKISGFNVILDFVNKIFERI
ncbi:MAG: hypothetical protein LBF97_07860 [Elusimicrobiota bacterium]|jgi:hypothetical protein|nr:hypothetical protein [Elusimicrobiota bacterium]